MSALHLARVVVAWVPMASTARRIESVVETNIMFDDVLSLNELNRVGQLVRGDSVLILNLASHSTALYSSRTL